MKYGNVNGTDNTVIEHVFTEFVINLNDDDTYTQHQVLINY